MNYAPFAVILYENGFTDSPSIEMNRRKCRRPYLRNEMPKPRLFAWRTGAGSGVSAARSANPSFSTSTHFAVQLALYNRRSPHPIAAQQVASLAPVLASAAQKRNRTGRYQELRRLERASWQLLSFRPFSYPGLARASRRSAEKDTQF